MIKNLFVNGCSWVEGHMLHLDPAVHNIFIEQGYEIRDTLAVFKDDVPIHYPYRDIYDRNIWASVIADYLNIPTITNYARGGASNDRILRTTVDYIKRLTPRERQETFVIIGWTIPDRRELYLDDKHGVADWCVWNGTQPFSSITKIHQQDYIERMDKFWELYVLDVFNIQACIQSFFQQSYLLANLLKQHNIKYYFFNTFPIYFGITDVNKVTEHMEYFQRDIEIYNNEIASMPLEIDFFNFIGGDSNDLLLPDRHPNKLGHTKWGNYLLEFMKVQEIV